MKYFNSLFGSIAGILLLFVTVVPQKAVAADKPSVLFMIAEQNIGQEGVIYWWSWFSSSADIVAQQIDLSVAETILSEEFLNADFNIIDIASVSDKITVNSAYKVADITQTVAIQLAKDVGADIVVKGKVLAKEGPKNSSSNVHTYMADITASAFRVSDGLVMGSGKGHGVARHVSEVTGGTNAIENATRQLAEKLVSQIQSKWATAAP
ncbi:MAG: hypothetical protein AMJ53_00550 [Gammaproteobacteria bacterium SG8_11]|nr:MAG: hypothetical protein AMJ53_00550 [Gammaproteobacteria bacterium SG8_11]